LTGSLLSVPCDEAFGLLEVVSAGACAKARELQTRIANADK
jgi:hypothetical protein